MKKMYQKCLLVLIFILIGLSTLQAEQIGYYFGTFDPIHNGHINVALSAIKFLHLDKLYILPNYVPSNKPNASKFDDRYNMVSLISAQNKNLAMLPRKAFKRAYEKNKKHYIPLLIKEVMKVEGKDNKYFHICGTDSFLKMAEGNHLPTKDENRIVVVMKRKGYTLSKNTKFDSLKKRGQLIIFDPELEKLSSTKLRKAFEKGIVPDSSKIPSVISHYVLRNNLYNSKPPVFKIPSGYKSSIVNLRKGPSKVFLPKSILSLISVKSLVEESTLNIEEYLKQKIPLDISTWALTRNAKVILLGGMWTDALSYLSAKGFQSAKIISSTDKSRIHYKYIITRKDNKSYLIVTNFFGSLRLKHLTLQYSNLIFRDYGNLDNLRVVIPDNYYALTKNLCYGSLRKLDNLSNTIVCIGYHGSLNHVIRDLTYRKNNGQNYSIDNLPITPFDKKLVTKNIINLKPMGNKYFPYWEYSIKSRGKTLNLVSFRNLYGDQTEIVIKSLINKGAKYFIIFGSCGAFDRQLLNRLIAPSYVLFENKLMPLKNQALNDYKAAVIKPVYSILEETQVWLSKVKNCSATEVESNYIRNALLNAPNAKLYFGLFVTDIPGIHGYSLNNGNSNQAILQKRRFWINALKWGFKRIY